MADEISEDSDRAAIRRVLRAVQRIRADEPGLSLNGLEALLVIALDTLDRDVESLPRAASVGRRMGLTSNGANQLLRALAHDSRGKKEALGLLQPVDFSGRSEGYFLSDKGRERVRTFWTDILGHPPREFTPLGKEDLLRLLMRKMGR